MEDWAARELARRYVEERILRVRWDLALDEAWGGGPGARELEEALLEELAELESALQTGTLEPYVRWV